MDVGLQTLGVSGLSVYTESGHAGTILSAALADEIEQDVDGIRTLMPIKAQSGTVRVGHTTEHAVLLGADERLGEVMQMEMLAGTLPNAWQCANAEPVAVVGDDLAQTLYRRTNITGRQIRLKVNGTDRYFTVCGVVRAQTGAFGGMLSAVAPHLVYVPYACIASQTERTDQVFVQCISQTDTASVSSQIEKYLTDRQQVRGVHVQNMSGCGADRTAACRNGNRPVCRRRYGDTVCRAHRCDGKHAGCRSRENRGDRHSAGARRTARMIFAGHFSCRLCCCACSAESSVWQPQVRSCTSEQHCSCRKAVCLPDC